jgi:ketosteroid isomerase-like protein
VQRERQLEIVQALYDASAVADWKGVEAHLTDDFFVSEGSHMPFAGVYRGRTGLRDLYTKVMGMMDVTGLEVRARMAGDDHVIYLIDMVFAGEPPTRATLTELFRFRGDKVCEIQPFYFDAAPVVAAVQRKTRKAG